MPPYGIGGGGYWSNPPCIILGILGILGYGRRDPCINGYTVGVVILIGAAGILWLKL